MFSTATQPLSASSGFETGKGSEWDATRVGHQLTIPVNQSTSARGYLRGKEFAEIMVSKRKKVRGLTSALGLALLAALAFSAIAAGAAQANSAPRWIAEGEDLGGGETRAFKATTTTQAILAVPGLSLTFENPSGKCTSSGKIVGSTAETPGKVQSAVLTCTEIKVQGAPACRVSSPGQPIGTVSTQTLAGTLVWLGETGGQAGLLLRSEGSSITILEIDGCAAQGVFPLTGEVIGKLSPVEEEVETAALGFQSPPILNWWSNAKPRVKQSIKGLRISSQPVTLSAAFNTELNPSEAFGVFPG